MKIVFTQFTPPFEHGMTEMEYLRYDDWFSKLRKAFAKNEEVFFISLTKNKKLITIRHDGYNALFFPVENPDQRQSKGRMWYENNEVCPWLLKQGPHVIHIIGSGSQMGLKILKTIRDPLLFLWERCTVNENTLGWEELDLCDYYVHPTLESIERALKKVPENRLLKTPLGADTVFFRPLDMERQFDIVSAGRLTPAKGIATLQEVVNKVSFVGNEVLKKSDLSNQLELKPSSLSLFSKPTFDRRLLKLDAISIKNYYHAQGFLEVAVKDSFSISNDGVDVFFVIEEGNIYLLNDVKFNGLKSINEKSVRSILGLKQGAPYNPVRINTNLTLVDEEYQENGKLYVKFDIQQEIKDSVNIVININ